MKLTSLKLAWKQATLPSVPAEANPLRLINFFPAYAVNGVGTIPRAEFVTRAFSPPVTLGAHVVMDNVAILDPFGGNLTGGVEASPLYEPAS